MAKIDELHNYAFPDKYLDELHIYDKKLGSNDFDEVHNYGDRGVTYGMDELHLYGSYQTEETSIDEINKSDNKYEVIDIDEYFDEIEYLDEQQKEERKELANEFKDIMMLIFALMLADLRLGNDLNEGFYHSLAKSRLMDAVDRIMPSLTVDIYVEIENYINQNLNYVIETTINNPNQPYTFSEARATSIAVDDALGSFNIEELEEAKKAGYKYKIWKTMEDDKVRLNHRKVDGKKVKIDDAFEVGRCLMQAPLVFDENSHFQDAKEVVNCRCQLIYSNSKDKSESQTQSKKVHVNHNKIANDFTSPINGYAKAGLKYVNPDEDLFEYADKIKPEKGFTDVVCHADKHKFYIDMVGNNKQDDFVELKVSDLAKHIKDSPQYNGGDIRLISCGAGALGDESPAKKLAKKMNVNVKAPTETILVADNGEYFISDNETLAELWYNDGKIDHTIRPTGDWKVFSPK